MARRRGESVFYAVKNKRKGKSPGGTAKSLAGGREVMGGPSYQTPYPVSDTKGGQVIWNWGTKSWGPYTQPKPGVDAKPVAGTPDSDGGGGKSNAPDTSDKSTGDRMGGGDRSPDPAAGPGMPEVKRGTVKTPRRRMTSTSVSMPGQSLLGGNY
jgi:hypothetical protein